MERKSSRFGATVVVPTYNRAARLSKSLEALMSQDYGPGYEVVVVDDGSDDQTPQVLADWCRRYPNQVRAFRQENAGPARARNHGARAASGQFVVFIDDDCVADRSWLRNLVGVADQRKAAAVAGTVVNGDDGWVGRYVNLESVIDHVFSERGEVKEIVTGNFGVRNDVFRALNGFDEEIRVAGGEDTEFGLRLVAAGHAIAFAPEARVYHPAIGGVLDYLRMIFRHGRGLRTLSKRFPRYRIRFPLLRCLWVLWPIRAWLIQDYLRYRRQGVSVLESTKYLLLRYLENPARLLGFMRGR
ncbi:MAG: glycosyltransferase [Vicinamibacteria bacterium]